MVTLHIKFSTLHDKYQIICVENSDFRYFTYQNLMKSHGGMEILKLNRQANAINILSTPEKHVNVFSIRLDRGVYSLKIAKLKKVNGKKFNPITYDSREEIPNN